MIHTILTAPQADEYLQTHQLVPQFQRAVEKLKNGQFPGLDFKKRAPKSLNIWSFRITKKYRAWARRQQGIVTIYRIDDHQ